MIDNLDIKARNSDVPDIDFLCETLRYFDVTGEHNFRGESVIAGTLDKNRSHWFAGNAMRRGFLLWWKDSCAWPVELLVAWQVCRALRGPFAGYA
jgi:hypothetical protein